MYNRNSSNVVSDIIFEFFSIFSSQVMVFTNLHSFLSEEAWVSAVIEIVEASLRDDRLEVREKSAKILSGLLHCEFIRGDRKRKLIVSCHASRSRTELLRGSFMPSCPGF